MRDSTVHVEPDPLPGLIPEGQRDWWQRALQATAGELDRARFASSYTAAARRVGSMIVEVKPGEPGRALDHLVRAVLLERATSLLDPDQRASFVHRLFETGDNREREALLHALCGLPDPERYLETAIEACRTNVVPVFEAIACDNDFPARHFPEASFHQMVLKAIFLEVPVVGIRGLESRTNPELVRMVRGYAEERRAAGRPVPADALHLTGEET